jgi:hypothetical protein
MHSAQQQKARPRAELVAELVWIYANTASGGVGGTARIGCGLTEM